MGNTCAREVAISVKIPGRRQRPSLTGPPTYFVQFTSSSSEPYLRYAYSTRILRRLIT
jgi:hypothetical protein